MDKKVLKKLHVSQVKILDEIVRICKKENLRYYLMGGTLLGAVRHSGFIPWDDDLDIAMPREDYEKFISLCQKELGDQFLLDDITTNDKYWLMFSKIRLKNSEFISKNENMKYVGSRGIWVDIFPLDYTSHDYDSYLKRKGKLIAGLKSIYFHKHNPKNSKSKKFILPFFSFVSMKCLNKIIYKVVTNENDKKNNKYIINYGSQYGVKKQTHLINKIFPLKDIMFEGKYYSVPNDYDYVLKKIYGNNYMKLPPIEKRVTHNPVKIIFEDGEEVIFNEEV